jgi:hypothetical protein
MTFFHKAMRKLPTSKAVVGRVDTLKQQIKKSKTKVGRHCCTKMTYYLTFDKKTKEINPDAIIRFHKTTKDYGIPIHDGGSSFIEIEFCPWCGTKLKK